MASAKFKVILLGDTGVGKTSIARRQSQDTFDFKMTPTVGASHLRAAVQLDDQAVDLLLWDTAGQEQFVALVPMYARGANVCIIVGSIMNPDSCDHIPVWRDRLFDAGERPPIVAAINKIDLLEGAPLTIEAVKAKLAAFPSLYFVSAKTGDSIPGLFTEVAQIALRGKDAAKAPSIDIPDQPGAEAGGCC
jgi:small GTP-binding protein